jgi:hypothetical protein
MTENKELPRHYRVYVPRPGSRYEQLIDGGSGIVGTLEENGRIVLDYEGNRYSSPSLAGYADRVHHAAGRHGVRYPTIARALVDPDEVIEVGDYDYETGVVTLYGAEERELLEHWLGSGPLDDGELRTKGNTRHTMRREVEQLLANPATREQGRWLARHYKINLD